LPRISEHTALDHLNSLPAATNTSTHFTDPKTGPTSLPVATTSTSPKAEDEKLSQSLMLPKLKGHIEKRSLSVPDEEPLHPSPKPQGKS